VTKKFAVASDLDISAVCAAEVQEGDEPFLVYVKSGDVSCVSDSVCVCSAVCSDFERDVQKILDSSLSPTQKVQLVEMLVGHSAQFEAPTGVNRELPAYSIQHAQPERPFIQHRGRLTKQEREVVDATIKKLMDKGWIEPCVSVWGSPMLFVKKPNGELRLVIDYKALNAQTVSDGHKLPLIDDLLQKMGGKRFYSKMDLHEGYHQVPLCEDTAYKSAFTTPYGDQYQWKVMPMGLKGAPNHFSRMMVSVLKPLIEKGVVVVYLDDVLIASNSYEEHLKHIDMVLSAMARVGLKVKLQKCAFAARSVEFLGHVLDSCGVRVQQSKVKALTGYAEPQSAADIETFLGMIGIYRKFILNLAKYEEPLREKARDWKNVLWGSAQSEAFETLKHLVSSTPVLHVADQNRAFVMHVDASEYAMGCVLQQDFGAGLQPVAFHSCKLTDGQQKYLNQKREFFAIMEGLRTWRHFLGGSGVCVTVYTDHLPNTRWQSSKFCLLDKMIAKWVVELQEEYPCVQIVHVQGKQNAVADALSRNPGYREATSSVSVVYNECVSERGCVRVCAPGAVMPDAFSLIGSMQQCFPMNAVFTFGPDQQLVAKFTAAYAAEHEYLSQHRDYVSKDGLFFTPAAR
jgi:hypothetical protein